MVSYDNTGYVYPVPYGADLSLWCPVPLDSAIDHVAEVSRYTFWPYIGHRVRIAAFTTTESVLVAKVITRIYRGASRKHSGRLSNQYTYLLCTLIY